MPYIFQTFTSGQVFTGGQAQQIEDNIRDHTHGLNGVGAAGLSFSPNSATATFTVTQANAAQNIEVSGSYQINFSAAATLGAAFGVGLTNVGSGRIVLAAAASQFIGPSSVFVLTPGEYISVVSNGVKLNLLGNLTGQFLIHNEIFTSSTAFIRTTQFPWAYDFAEFSMQINALASSMATLTVSPAVLQWSSDSGSSFVASGYVERFVFTGSQANNRTGVPIQFMVLESVVSSGFTAAQPQNFSSNVKFNIIPQIDTASLNAFISHFVDGSTVGASQTVRDAVMVNFGVNSTAAAVAASINAFRLTTAGAAAYIQNGSIRIWGRR